MIKTNIYEKLFTLQQKLKAPKNQYNKFGDFHYRSCEDIQEALKPLLREVEVVLIVSDEVIQIGNRFYIKATVRLQDIKTQESIVNVAYARETEEKPKMDAAQVTGSCSSYARKYALNGLFCIDDSKDPDYLNGRQQATPVQTPRQRATKPKLGQKELAHLKKEAERTGTDLSKVCERYKVNSINELNSEQYQRALVAFSKMETMPKASDQQCEMDFSETEKGIEEMEKEMPFA